MTNYTNRELLQIIQNKAEELGRTPKRREVPQNSIIRLRFGSWLKAVELAQLPELPVEKYTEVELIEYLKQAKAVIDAKGEQFSLAAYIELNKVKTDFPSYGTFTFRFGSWNKALKAAALDTHELRDWEALSNEQLLDILIEYAEDDSLSLHVFRALANVPPPDLYQRRFGSWNIAIEKAGLEPKKANSIKYTDKELLEALILAKKLCDNKITLKRYQKIQKKHDLPSASTFVYRFGSWKKAKERIEEGDKHRGAQ